MARIVKVATSEFGKPYEVCWSWYDAEGKRYFKKARYRTLTDAKAKRREVEDAVASASVPNYKDGKKALAVYGEKWLDKKRAKRKPSTIRSYEAIYNASVKPAFGHRRINAIPTADVQDWIDALLARHLTPPTIRHHAWVLSQIFATAAAEQAIRYNPMLGVTVPTEDDSSRVRLTPRFLTQEEVEAVARELDTTPPYGLLVRFAAWTGLRAGELAGLNIGDVVLMRKEVHVRRTRERVGGVWIEGTPKSKASTRIVRLMPWTVEDLSAYLGQHPNRDDPNAPLWPGTRSGGYTHGERGSKVEGSLSNGCVDYSEPWERGTFYRSRFIPACVAAGVASKGKGNGVRFHDLRHTFASLCNSRGIPSQQVAKWMGHASDTITREIYTHLFAADTDVFVEQMAAGGRPTPPPSSGVGVATVTEIRRVR